MDARIGKMSSSIVQDKGYFPNNGEVLNKFSESLEGKLLYDGSPVSESTGSSEISPKIYITGPLSTESSVIISKPLSLYYNSFVVNIQEFVTDGLSNVEEVARDYNNNSSSSFEINDLLLFDAVGVSLINKKTYTSTVQPAIDNGYFPTFTALDDLNLYESLEVI